MADTAPTTTTRPSRARKAAPAKATPAKAAPAKAAPTAPANDTTRLKVELEPAGDTKNFTKFVVPASMESAVRGQIYAPLGSARVGLIIIGEGDQGEE